MAVNSKFVALFVDPVPLVGEATQNIKAEEYVFEEGLLTTRKDRRTAPNPYYITSTQPIAINGNLTVNAPVEDNSGRIVVNSGGSIKVNGENSSLTLNSGLTTDADGATVSVEVSASHSLR